MTPDDAPTDAARLAEAIERLIRAIERPPVERLAYRADELASAMGVGRRTIEREVSAGRLPAPSRRVGKIALWDVDAIRTWLARGDQR